MNKVTKTDYEQWENRAEGHSARVYTDDYWTSYAIYTEHGIVLSFVYVGNGRESVLLEFVWDGNIYRRQWLRAWAKTTITQLAKAFASEIAK